MKKRTHGQSSVKNLSKLNELNFTDGEFLMPNPAVAFNSQNLCIVARIKSSSESKE